jgi:hypothetical protein
VRKWPSITTPRQVPLRPGKRPRSAFAAPDGRGQLKDAGVETNSMGSPSGRGAAPKKGRRARYRAALAVTIESCCGTVSFVRIQPSPVDPGVSGGDST